MTIPEQRLQLKLTALNEIRDLFNRNLDAWQLDLRDEYIEEIVKKLEKELKLLK